MLFNSSSDTSKWKYYVYTIFPVGFVRAVTPFCWLLLIAYYSGYESIFKNHLPRWFYSFALWYMYLEVPFSIYYQYLCHVAQKRKPLPTQEVAALKQLLLQCLDVGLGDKDGPPKREATVRTNFEAAEVSAESAEKARNKFRQWFFSIPMDAIKADNAREWLAWAMAHSSLEEIQEDPEIIKLIDSSLQWLSIRLQHDFKPGYNSKARCIRLSLDKMRVMHRPIGYYVVCNAATALVYAWLCFHHGFSIVRSGECQFLVRHASKSPSTPFSQLKHPVIFLHGLGIGIAQNILFLNHLADSDQTAIVLLQPNISAEIWHPRFLDAPSKQDHVEALKGICKKMGVQKATVVSQSNGTMVHSWLLRSMPELCHRNILVDPVCFRLWEADVCYNFLYKPWSEGLHVLLGYFVARELGTAHTIARNFNWTDMILWAHEIPRTDPDHLHIVIGLGDYLIDPPTILEYLQECGVSKKCITAVKGAPHGQGLVLNAEGYQAVLKHL